MACEKCRLHLFNGPRSGRFRSRDPSAVETVLSGKGIVLDSAVTAREAEELKRLYDKRNINP